MVPVSCVITSNNSSWANDCDDVICREMLPLATDWMQMAAFVVRNVIGWWSASSDSILRLCLDRATRGSITGSRRRIFTLQNNYLLDQFERDPSLFYRYKTTLIVGGGSSRRQG